MEKRQKDFCDRLAGRIAGYGACGSCAAMEEAPRESGALILCDLAVRRTNVT